MLFCERRMENGNNQKAGNAELGEMMLYTSFALLVQHWLPWIVLAYWWTNVFFVNMLLIESSISRYPEWEAYKARTGRLLPWRFFTRKPDQRSKSVPF
jgi:hypothetical protein